MGADDLTLRPAFNFYYVSDQVWSAVSSQVQENDRNHLQLVNAGANPMHAAGNAGTWLARADKKITNLYIVAHGAPGEFTLGVNVTADNVAPLGGWLRSFFEPDGRIRILGCECGADDRTTIGGYVYGQRNPINAKGISHRGYLLMKELAVASQQTVEAPLNGQLIVPLGLKMTSRRVLRNGAESIFNP